jgi:hypothetical protein
MPEFLQFAFSGLTVGAVYALVALGFTLIYNASDVINFAQGEFVMLGGMTTVFLALAGVPLPAAACLAIAFTVVVGLALYRFAIAPAQGAGAVALIIITIGASIFLRGAAQVVFDKRFHSLPPWFGSEPIRVGGAAILPQSLVVLAGALVVVVLLGAFIERTLTGKAIVAPPPTSSPPACRHRHPPRRRPVLRHLGGDRRARRHPDHADHADQLRRRHLARAQGLRRRHARRHRQRGRRGDGRAAARIARSLRRRLRVLSVQGRRRVPRDPARAVRHAAGLFGRASAERV